MGAFVVDVLTSGLIRVIIIVGLAIVVWKALAALGRGLDSIKNPDEGFMPERRPDVPGPRGVPAPPADPHAPICGCGHHLAFHDRAEGGCHQRVPLPDDSTGPCRCSQYIGPEPLPQFYAPELADVPPPDAPSRADPSGDAPRSALPREDPPRADPPRGALPRDDPPHDAYPGA